MTYALMVLAVLTRLLPHPMNFAPIGALGLFAGATVQRRWAAWAVPVVALLASDAVLGFYNPLLMLFVYAGFALSGWMGWAWLRERPSVLRLGLAASASAILFFGLSNLGCWVLGFYPHTLSGLDRCFVMALPLFGNTLLSNLLYTTALFGLYEGTRQWVARRQVIVP